MSTKQYPILFVRNLQYTVSRDDLYELFGKYGPIQQIRLGNTTATRGTAFVVYESMRDATEARDKLSGFNYQKRYLVVSFHQVNKLYEAEDDIEARKRNLEDLKREHNIS